MARRPKKQSLIEIALNGSWVVATTFAIALLIIVFFAVPSITNPILKSIALALKPIGLFLAVIFGLMALVKFILHNQTESQSKPSWNTPPNTSLSVFKTASNDPIVGSLGNSQSLPILQPQTVWTLQLIQEIEWKKFEDLSTAYYHEKGIKAEATPLGADGGIDIKLYQDNSGNPTSIVQCKAWANKQVGVKEIREFLGVMTHHKIVKGFYMTSGDYSVDAKDTATSNKISLINGEMLLALIKRLPESSQQKLLLLATEGCYTTPTCSACGVKMVKRNGKRGEFWGCKNFPRCRHMLQSKRASR
ncbi:MAG: restriction endonuclease [Methylotenera sp.]|nr:restriction endonuclease [Methylotenera sp.]MDO9388051.1 restriction endonuclease [Methylotenera sp.]